ncbi:hypothetical protein Lal_00018752 [Lupinus albus]|nr:hypothetical protein Lal_00018752 [Lupinus albus]
MYVGMDSVSCRTSFIINKLRMCYLRCLTFTLLSKTLGLLDLDSSASCDEWIEIITSLSMHPVTANNLITSPVPPYKAHHYGAGQN